MQWYFLFLIKGGNRQELAFKYLSHFTLLASRVAGQLRLAASHIDQLAPGQSFHYAFVPHSFEGPTSAWVKTTFETFPGDLQRSAEKLEQLQGLCPFPSECARSEGDSMARMIHVLLDQLPGFGTFMLDAVLDEALFDQLDVKDNVQLFGALLRLWKWHQTPACPSGTRFAPWRTQLGIGRTPTLSRWLPLWKGLARVGNGTPFGNFEIECLAPSAELTACFGVGMLHQDRHMAEDDILWSSTIQVVDEFDLESLPAHLLCPVSFRLVTRSPRQSKASVFLQECSTSPEKCAVVRLSYWEVCELRTPPPRRTSQSWRAAVEMGQWLPDAAGQQPNGNLHFALVPHHGAAMLLPLHWPPPALISSLACPEGSYEPVGEQFDCLQRIPLVTATSIFSSVQRINTTFLAALRDTLDRADATGLASALSEGSIDLDDLVVDSAVVPMSAGSTFSSFSGCQLSELIGDPSDWPERRALLQGSADTAFDRRKNGSALKTIAVSAKDILRYFDESGNAKRPPTETIYYERSTGASPMDRGQLKTAEWPRCLECKYHDVYYSVDESGGQSAVERTLMDETGTTCVPNRPPSVLAQAPRAASAGSSHGSSPVLRRSPRKVPSRQPTEELCKKSPRKGARVTSEQAAGGRLWRKSGQRRSTAEVASLLQRSPQGVVSSRRRFDPVRTKGGASSLNSSGAKQKLRLKLRVAVANALERNGVQQRSSLFKSCGKKLFAICWTFAEDLVGCGRTSQLLQNIADSHVKQVVEFECRRTAGLASFDSPG